MQPVNAPRTTAPLQRKYPKAPVGRRFLAHLLDAVISIGPIACAAFIMATVGDRSDVWPMVAIVLIIAAGVWAIYYGFAKDGREGGRSIGKGTMDLMVVNINTNRPCTSGESAVRALLLGVLSAIPLVGWIIEPLTLLVNEQGRRVGDMAAGTQVIEARLYNAAEITTRRAA